MRKSGRRDEIAAAVISGPIGGNDHFPKKEVVPLTGALLEHALRARFKLHAVEDPYDVTTILDAHADAPIVDKVFNSPDNSVLIGSIVDERVVNSDYISRS